VNTVKTATAVQLLAMFRDAIPSYSRTQSILLLYGLYLYNK